MSQHVTPLVLSLPKHAREDRVDLLQVIAEVEQLFEFSVS